MSSSLSHCVIKLHEEHHDLEDYQGGVPRWCNGCGDNAILAAMQRLARKSWRQRTPSSCRGSAARAGCLTT